jgi:hypothetical protein
MCSDFEQFWLCPWQYFGREKKEVLQGGHAAMLCCNEPSRRGLVAKITRRFMEVGAGRTAVVLSALAC